MSRCINTESLATADQTMTRTSLVSTHFVIKLLMAAAMVAAHASTVHAAYTVMDDDLYPTAYIQARESQHEQAKKTIPFARQRTLLGPAGRASIDALLPLMRNAGIRIIGRPDATTHSTGALSTLAGDRAISVRNYLVQKGVPITAIKMETDESPNPQTNGSIYPIDIHITATAPSNAGFTENTSARNDTPSPLYELPSNTAGAIPAAPSSNNSEIDQNTNSEFVRYINNAVLNGQIHSSVAIKLLEDRMPKPPKWEILESDVTLQDTFARWGKLANWQIKWINIPEFKNTGHAEISGQDFLTVADYVLNKAKIAAKAVGLDISITAYSNNILVISKEQQK